MFQIALTDHLEGSATQPSIEIFNEVSELTRLADHLGVHYAFFTEHHAHAHHGHCPTPLLFALHLAGHTQQIRLGTAVICLNLHHPLDIAEQLAVADTLTAGRLAPGFGSGSTPEEFALFDLPETAEQERHHRFEQSLRTILNAWHPNDATADDGPPTTKPPPRILPIPNLTLPARSFAAVNSLGAARIAGRLNLNVLFSHLRTPEQYNQYRAAYHAAGGRRQIAANRPVYVAATDAAAFDQAEPALRTLWRRFQQEGKIPAEAKEPANPKDLCHHPINFLVGSPRSVADQLLHLHHQSTFDLANLEFRWQNLPHANVLQSLALLMTQVLPLIPTTTPRGD